MPLDHYRTQVLLLHSEQSTLDSLSSGFGDSYTVHCATSGSEALNTLVDTPINVIVTAQNLPGMSGIEALREAKKRSPDTIGILLAENEDTGLEALVGEKEVFQIVRGNVTGDSISKLVENATQQMRLMELANSANDAAANVDEPDAEHIVMETSENGAAIISDGSARLPALDPKKVSAASAVGSHAIDLLVLTKDNEFLATIKDSSRGTHVVHYAGTLAEADKLIREHKVGVAVVDAAMVGEKIEQLTAHLRKGSPRLVSIVAGRRDDGEMMMDLINRSKVYRFLLKPVSPGRARLAIEASVKHHLEAPEAAFKTKAVPPPTLSASQPAAPAARKPAPRPEPKPAPQAAAKKPPTAPPSESPASAKQASPYRNDPPIGTAHPPGGESLNDDALSDAFGGGESSFTETVTGLFATVSKKFSTADTDDEQPPAATAPTPSLTATTATTASTAPTDQEPAADDDFIEKLTDPKILGLGAVALVVAAAALFWLFGGSDEMTETASPPVEPPVAAETEMPVSSEAETPFGVDEAPIDTGSVADSSGDDAATIDVEAQIAGAIADAESALLESRIDEASAALELLGRIDPANQRLPFLTAQLAQIQLRTYLNDARAAIRENRFEDAGTALAAARSLNLPDTREIDAAEIEFTAAQNAQQAGNVLAQANARLEAGALLEPANDNARYYFELLLSIDPENLAARQGLSTIASKLAMQARIATDEGNLDAAEALLVESTALDPDNSELAAAVGALADRRATIAADQRRAEARRRAVAEERAAEERAAAEREAARQAAAAAAAAAPPREAVSLPDEPPATSADAAEGSGEGASAGAAESAQAADERPAAQAASTGPTPTTISELNRTKYVAPKYPRAAQRRNLSGWVDVIFTVDGGGLVKDISIRNSEPGDTFVNAAIRAVEKWEFEPVTENGQPVEKRVGVRMMFALE